MGILTMKELLMALLIVLLIISCATTAENQKKLWEELYSKSDMLYQQGRYAEAEEIAKEAF
jgi:outer membrane protein assembly factor BamD (BamD/ComL family)